MTVATWGAGSAIAVGVSGLVGGGALGSIAGGMAAAGFGSLVTEATRSFVNNEFDIGRMFEDLTSSRNLRGLGISMATAGLTQGLLSEIGDAFTGRRLTTQTSRSIVQTAVSTGFNVVTQDLDPREALTQMLVNVAVNIGGGMAAEGIGDLRVDNHINGLTQTGAHVVLGALVGAASNLRDPLRGAAGGGIGAGIAHIIAETLPPSLSDDRRLDIGVLGGGVGAFIAGVDTNAAGVAGTIAVERNSNAHRPTVTTTGTPFGEAQESGSSTTTMTTNSTSVASLSSLFEQGRSQLSPFLNPLEVNPGGPLSLGSGVPAKVTPKPNATAPNGNRPAANPQGRPTAPPAASAARKGQRNSPRAAPPEPVNTSVAPKGQGAQNSAPKPSRVKPTPQKKTQPARQKQATPKTAPKAKSAPKAVPQKGSRNSSRAPNPLPTKTKQTTENAEQRTSIRKAAVNGRAGRQKRLKELANDDKLGSSDRGWIKQEQNAIKRKSSKIGRDGVKRPQKHIRVPPTKELAHKRGKAAKDGNGYEHSDLQDIDLHKLQHKHEGYK